MIKENVIYNIDCFEGLKHIPEASIDMILCDLPYGRTRNKWDVLLPLDKLWAQYKRVCKGAIVLFAQTPFDKILGASNIKELKYEWVWVKENSTGFLNAKKAPLKKHENILVFYKKLPTYNPQFSLGSPYTKPKGGPDTHGSNYGRLVSKPAQYNEGYRYPTSVLEFPRDKEKCHPTQKPVRLCEYLIRTYTKEGDIVLDTCIGSGTTAIAARNIKRKFIGFEIETEYYETAKQRLKDDPRM